MNRLAHFLIIITLLLVATFPASSATAAELYLPDLILTDCDTICIPVLVRDFTAIAGVELHFTYDETCMTFDSVSPGLLGGATVNGGAGQVHIVWDDFENPLTLANDELVARICFSSITAPTGSPCAIGFQSNCELVDEIGDPVVLVTIDGSAACDAGGCCVLRGDVNHDGAALIDIADLLYLIDYMFQGGPEPVCFDEGDIDASATVPLDIGDLVYLIDYMFTGGPVPTSCP